MRKLQLTAFSAVFLTVGIGLANAGTVYQDNFTGGTSSFTAGDPYWTSNAGCNGYIVQTTNLSGVCFGEFGTAISSDVTGSGYFLFDGTGGPGSPAANGQFYISPSFAVAANTEYTLTFYLTNADTVEVADVTPSIDGTTLGAGVSAAGAFADGNPAHEWQQFSFSWNSGANTSATLTLTNSDLQASGNDFGLDDISVSPVTSATPEPGTFSLIGIAMLASASWLRRKR